MRVRASECCTRVGHLKRIAGWGRSVRWCMARASDIGRVERKRTKENWCRRGLRDAFLTRDLSARFCINSWAVFGPAWVTAAPKRSMNYARKHDSSKSPRPVCERTIPMISLLRRKRRTTQPSLLRRSESWELGARSWEPDCRLRLSALALLAVAVCVLNANAASELKWRSERADASARSTQSSSMPSRASTSTSLNSSSYAPSGNPLRFVRPQTSSSRIDNSVRLAAFEEDAPKLTSGGGGDTRTRSVVVNREDASDSLRSAQLPNPATVPGATGVPGAGGPSAPSADRLRSPFGDVNEPAPIE